MGKCLYELWGDVKYGAGSSVTLNPVTSYSTNAYDTIANWSFGPVMNFGISRDPGKLYNYGQCGFPKLSPPDRRYLKHVYKSIADGEGKFEFTNVPAGKYYVYSHVVWYTPDFTYGIQVANGGSITVEVVVPEGKSVKVILTR